MMPAGFVHCIGRIFVSANEYAYRHRFTLLVSLLAMLPALADQSSPQHPTAQYPAPKHLGVASCASSVCHGSVQPYPDGRIAQNEFIVWQTDRHGNMHAKAYAKLLTDEAKSIARKLGIGAAETAPECLSCHADHIPPERRGEEFQLADGVSCEACHGGAEHYIESHANPGISLADKQRDGLYPTWDPEKRAELCLSCHMGSGERMINHRIMGAGHPRLQFELDTFTYLQPHHRVDQDYINRKGRQDNARDWAVGQALAANKLLGLLQDSKHGWHGIFVEPVLLDCHSCHKRMDGDRWQARAGTGLGPGEMRLNDANLVMLQLIVAAIDPAAAERIRAGTLNLHRATTVSRRAVINAAAELQRQTAATTAQIAGHAFASDDLKRIFSHLQRGAEAGQLSDYAAAEQAAMAAVNLVTAFERAGLIEGGSLEPEIDRLFATVGDEYAYRPQRLAAAVRTLRLALP